MINKKRFNIVVEYDNEKGEYVHENKKIVGIEKGENIFKNHLIFYSVETQYYSHAPVNKILAVIRVR